MLLADQMALLMLDSWYELSDLFNRLRQVSGSLQMWEETRHALTPINLDCSQVQNLFLDLFAVDTKYQIQLSGQAMSSYDALLLCLQKQLHRFQTFLLNIKKDILKDLSNQTVDGTHWLSVFLSTRKSMGPINCLVYSSKYYRNILSNIYIFFYVQQKKEIHTSLEQLEGE